MSWSLALSGRIGALDLHVAFEAPAGCTALVGPNGAGKTTVLRAAAGAPLPLEGKIAVAGTTLFDSAAATSLAPEARRVGYVPQGYGLFPHLTAQENVRFACHHLPAAQRDAHARQLLQRLGVAHLAQRMPASLSGGEQQRVALARALAAKPLGLLLDEPLAALDVLARRELRSTLAAFVAETALPALVVSHDARDVFALASHVVVLEGGEVVQQGTPAAVAAAPGSDFVAAFFDGAN